MTTSTTTNDIHVLEDATGSSNVSESLQLGSQRVVRHFLSCKCPKQNIAQSVPLTCSACAETPPTGASWIPPVAAAAADRSVLLEFRHIAAPVDRAQPREFPRYEHSSWKGKAAYLRLSQTRGCQWHDLKAVCSRHMNCGRSRSCRSNRPIGELWSWLDFMHSDECLSKATHCAYIPSFETRCAARAFFRSLPDTEQYQAAEAVLPHDEPP